MKKKLFSILLHPLFLSLLITVLVVLLFLPSFPRYKAEIVDKVIARGTGIIMYEDLDGNGYSDRILTYTYENGTSCITVTFEPNLFFQEWDFRGIYGFTHDTYILTGDYDENGMRELYAFTISGDSILLHSITDLFSERPQYTTRFIARVGAGSDVPHLAIVGGEMDDLNMDGSKELFFALNAGFSLTPRQVCALDIKNDTLLTSPRNGYFIHKLVQADITGDGKMEIIVNGYASQNTKDQTLAVHDSCCWLIVLDQELRFLFPPKRFPLIGYSDLTTFPIPNKQGFHDLYSVYVPPIGAGEPCTLFHFDSTGNVLKKRILEDFSPDPFMPSYLHYQSDNYYIAIPDIHEQILLFDTSLKFVQEYPSVSPVTYSWKINLDKDPDQEIINLNGQRNQVIIFRQNMRDPVILDVDLGNMQKTSVSKILAPGEDPIMFIDTDDNSFLIAYGRNPLFYISWAIYAGIFLAIYLFALLMQKIQRVQLEKKYDTEKKITELQLKIVKNQMDPHFTMNAINSVIAAIQQDKKETASKCLLHFSKMYRSQVLSGDKFQRSLAEELEFSRNYLELEKFRFKDRFDYRIDLDPAVNLNIEVPKMIIQSPVENAVKHGLLNKESGGILIIRASVKDHLLILEVEDNGVGRKEAQKGGTEGTGKGLRIMEEFLELYHKITWVRIQWQVTDLFDDAGKLAGTRVVIKIPLEKGLTQV